MASQNPNLLKRAWENLVGTPEQNAKAEKDIAAYKAAKEKEKMKAEEEAKKSKTNLAKGGAVAKKKSSSVPPKGKVTKSGSKAGKTGKAPAIAIVIGLPKKAKTMAKGGAVKKKKGC